MFALEPIDQIVEMDDVIELEPPPVAQTASIGMKQSTIRWLPLEPTSFGALVLSGTWDEPQNELSAWSVRLDKEPASSLMQDAEDEEVETNPRQVGSAPHEGCVLDLAVSEQSNRATLVAYTASGAGGVSCYSVLPDEEGRSVALERRWHGVSPANGAPTLGVAVKGDSVAAVDEDGGVTLARAESGQEKWRVESSEAALYASRWWDPSTLAVAGAVVSLWDVRAPPRVPCATLAPAGASASAAGPALLCMSVDPRPPNRLAAGSAEGAVHVWDVRAGAMGGGAMGGGAMRGGAMRGGATGGMACGVPPKRSFAAHASDVWDVQLGECAHGDVLTCGSDGLLHAWDLGALARSEAEDTPRGHVPLARAHADVPLRHTLVQLELPINSLELSTHGVLAAASDAQVLTFVDYHH